MLRQIDQRIANHRRDFKRHVQKDDLAFSTLKARVNLLILLIIAILPVVYFSAHQ